jgi:transcription antitermination factor NusG
MAKRWYCVQARPGKEFYAETNLNRMGFQTLLLTELRERAYRGGTRREYRAPLLGSYFFVAFDVHADNWRSIYRGAYGVRRLLSGSPEHPTPVPDATLASLLQCAVEAPKPSQPIIAPDTRVRIIAGPLLRPEQYITGICNWRVGDRVGLLLDIMNGTREVIFDVNSLEPIP